MTYDELLARATELNDRLMDMHRDNLRADGDPLALTHSPEYQAVRGEWLAVRALMEATDDRHPTDL